jgi:mono/diheme cytochrome c family protein
MGWVFGVALAGLGCGALAVAGAHRAADAKLLTPVEQDGHAVPVPWPLSAEDAAAAREAWVAAGQAGEPDLEAAARLAAVRRGKHLAEARYGCLECHGADFGGGVMIDDPMVGEVKGPNLTAGQGGVVAGYTPADWDRIVRHGVKRGGTPAIMPSDDFVAMSDQELSDLIAYVSSVPPVDRAAPPVSLGPLGAYLVASGEMRLTALAPTPQTHAPLPPDAKPDATFGAHLVQVCTGCHGAELRGGPIPGAPPQWAPASDLRAITDWSFDQFVTAMRQGVRPDGTALRPPMTIMAPYATRMTEVELRALWAYISAAP